VCDAGFVDVGKSSKHLPHQLFNLLHTRRLTHLSLIDSGYLVEFSQSKRHKLRDQIEILSAVRCYLSYGITFDPSLFLRVVKLLQVYDIWMLA
jgi:hypothetical protein